MATRRAGSCRCARRAACLLLLCNVESKPWGSPAGHAIHACRAAERHPNLPLAAPPCSAPNPGVADARPPRARAAVWQRAVSCCCLVLGQACSCATSCRGWEAAGYAGHHSRLVSVGVPPTSHPASPSPAPPPCLLFPAATRRRTGTTSCCTCWAGRGRSRSGRRSKRGSPSTSTRHVQRAQRRGLPWAEGGAPPHGCTACTATAATLAVGSSRCRHALRHSHPPSPAQP